MKTNFKLQIPGLAAVVVAGCNPCRQILPGSVGVVFDGWFNLKVPKLPKPCEDEPLDSDWFGCPIVGRHAYSILLEVGRWPGGPGLVS